MGKIVSFGLGAASILYFCFYAALSGLSNKFTFFWLLLGMGCIAVGVFNARICGWVKGLPRPIRYGMAGVLLAGALLFVAVEAVIIGYSIGAPKAGADYVVVLGAQVRGKRPSYNLCRRLDAACQYLGENPNTRVILSGGQGSGEEISEAQAMAEYLEEKGIERERMILEDQSRNTDENLRYSREKMTETDPKVVLATNGFHVFRSVRIAKKQGLTQVEGLGAPVQWYTVPNMYVREGIAVIKYALCGQI